jgi:hypothetical protein
VILTDLNINLVST